MAAGVHLYCPALMPAESSVPVAVHKMCVSQGRSMGTLRAPSATAWHEHQLAPSSRLDRGHASRCDLASPRGPAVDQTALKPAQSGRFRIGQPFGSSANAELTRIVCVYFGSGTATMQRRRVGPLPAKAACPPDDRPCQGKRGRRRSVRCRPALHVPLL